MDARLGRRGQLCRRAHYRAGKRRDHARYPAARGPSLAASQALDHPSRPRRPPDKKQRARRLRLTGAHPDWALGFGDAVWWSRLAVPALHAWVQAKRPRRLIEPKVATDDPDPKALACYGVLLSGPAAPGSLPEPVGLRFVPGRPVSNLTIPVLAWACAKLQALGKTVWCVIWDNASWHRSRTVRIWIQRPNRQVKQAGQGIRLLPGYLPVKSPWLNRLEPYWLHAKRRIVELDRLLSAAEVEERVYACFDYPSQPPLVIPENVV